MVTYYCPFCSTRYQSYRTKIDGVLICNLCGDPLYKKPFINFRQIVGGILTFALLAPFLVILIFILKEFNKEELEKNSESIVQLYIEGNAN